MSSEQIETKQDICLKSHLCKIAFWGILAAAFLIIFIGLPITHWIL
jgi:hypothetical protein